MVGGRGGASGFVMEAGVRVWPSGGDVWLVGCVGESYRGGRGYRECCFGHLIHGGFVEGTVRE